ncbi:MAG: DUF805 domain-containing protein [Tannerellaceae bacterium]|nr:DUF805 domain-containing protein [Tannerellaceae bacterium]
MRWFIKALTRYADFDGRARRREYRMFVLVQFHLWPLPSLPPRIYMDRLCLPVPAGGIACLAPGTNKRTNSG